MTSKFAELMAISASQTAEAELATQQLLEERRRKEKQRKEAQEEKERRERELQKKLVLKELERQRREEQRKEEERQRREQLLEKLREEQRKDLVYGKDRRSRATSGEHQRKSRQNLDDEDDAAGAMLTREEKRQRKMLAGFNASKRPPSSASPGNYSKRLSRPGNIVDLSQLRAEARLKASHSVESLPTVASVTSGTSALSLRQQLAAMPTTLIRLNTVKRDTRTIAEIVEDKEKAKEIKVLAGDEAREFRDWFGDSKKQDGGRPSKKSSGMESQSPPPPSPPAQSLSQPTLARPQDRSVPSKATSRSATGNIISQSQSQPQSQPSGRKEPRTKVTIVKPEPKGSVALAKGNKIPQSSVISEGVAPSSTARPSTLASSRTNSGSIPTVSSTKKRPRSHTSSSLSSEYEWDKMPSSKRRNASSSVRNDLSSEIWRLFGKDRNRYVNNDVFSDEDDDMEADADDLRREELRSARIAKREDDLAFEEEKCHEEEKRHKKREREQRERKGY